MTFLDLVRRRAMTRAFDPDREISEADLDQLLEAARRVPSAGFTQAVSWLVLIEDTDRDDYWRLTRRAPDDDNAWLRGMSAAPVLLLVWTSEEAYRQRYTEPDKGWDHDDDRWSAPYWWVDAGMAVQNVLLAATDRGLGAAFVGVPPDRQTAVAERFGVPAGMASVGLVAIGHPRQQPHDQHRRPQRPRRAAAELVHRGRWGSP
ncbi:nitroreductase family protein [Propionibacteriaceae bacterium Y1685]|uniref:nitroreductase family protein n=1 Tax=Microlunatus sp. Y1700 TaxID=3418487 RepID=UPI003B7E353E